MPPVDILLTIHITWNNITKENKTSVVLSKKNMSVNKSHLHSKENVVHNLSSAVCRRLKHLMFIPGHVE